MARDTTNAAAQEETEAERLRVDIALLHAAGKSVREIADDLTSHHGRSISKSAVQRHIDAIRDEYKREYAATYEQHCANALRRLRALEKAIMPAALKGDARSVMAALGVHDREAALLGLNKPLKLQVASSIEFRGALDEEVAGLVERLQATAIDTNGTDRPPPPALPAAP